MICKSLLSEKISKKESHKLRSASLYINKSGYD